MLLSQVNRHTHQLMNSASMLPYHMCRCAPKRHYTCVCVNFLKSELCVCVTTIHEKVFSLSQLPWLHHHRVLMQKNKKWAWNYVVKFMWGCYSFWTSFYTIWCKYTWNKSSPYIWLLHENMHSVLVIHTIRRRFCF